MDLKLLIVASALVAASPACAVTNISFGGLTGANGSAVTTYTESGYTFSAISGSLAVVTQYGSKELGTTSSANVALTYSGGTFVLNVLGGLTGGSAGAGSISYLGYLGNSQVSSGSYNYNSVTGAVYVAVPVVAVDKIVFSLNAGTAPNIAFSLSNVSPAAIATVPEPASWAMMICGFGAIGAAMRRRPVKVSFA